MTGRKIKTIFYCMFLLLMACGKLANKESSIELISEPEKQQSVFENLLKLTNSIPESKGQDSLAFLILPVQASCPACRKKTIDSLIKHKDGLNNNHFVIISANGGRKTIGSYFKEEKAELPEFNNKLFLDSTNVAFKYDLYTDKPTMYYTYNRRAYKKVAAIPITVREDLREFFSGYRKK